MKGKGGDACKEFRVTSGFGGHLEYVGFCSFSSSADGEDMQRIECQISIQKRCWQAGMMVLEQEDNLKYQQNKYRIQDTWLNSSSFEKIHGFTSLIWLIAKNLIYSQAAFMKYSEQMR